MTAARSAGGVAALAALAAALGALLSLGAARAGPATFLVPLALAAGALMILHAKATVMLLVVLVVLLEGDSEGFMGFTVAAYDALPVQVHELLLGAAIAGVVLDRLRTRRPLRTPGPFTLPLLLLLVAMAAGAVTGFFNGAGPSDIANTARDLVVLAVLPFVAVNVIEGEEDVEQALRIAVPLVAAKVVLGAAGWLLGEGRPIEGTVLTYYEPLPNLVLLMFVLYVLAGTIDRRRLPALTRLLGLAALAVLILSFRRNFWIGLVVGAILVVLVAAGARGRALLIPAGAALALALWLGLTALNSSQSTSPVIQRAQTLAPTRLQTQADDRYRLDEQRNVIAELREQPLTGLGLGVPWTARHPLAVYFPGARDYTHVTVLWWWLKLGILGLVAYAWIVATVVRSGLALWRRSAAARRRAAGLAVAGGILALAVAETTGSFTGVESRVSTFLGVLFAWLAVALAVERDAGAPA